MPAGVVIDFCPHTECAGGSVRRGVCLCYRVEIDEISQISIPSRCPKLAVCDHLLDSFATIR
jgi:hypothetical protein